MIGIVLICHEPLAASMKTACESVVGKQEYFFTIDIGRDDDMAKRRHEIILAAKLVDTGSGVIIITDTFGGTPSTLAIAVMKKANAEVISGANLPMLIKLSTIRSEESFDEAVKLAQEAGRKYINVASWVISGEAPENFDVSNVTQNAFDIGLTFRLVLSQINNEIRSIEETRPNSEEAKIEAEAALKFLKSVRRSVSRVVETIVKLEEDPENGDEHLRELEARLSTLQSEITNWWAKNKADVVDWAIRFPAIGAAIGLLNVCGASHMLATGAAIAGIGGPKLIKQLRDLLRSEE